MRIYLLAYLLLAFTHLSAQQSYPVCTRQYFHGTHQVATSYCYDSAGRWGRASAFDRSGKIIYEKEIRRVGGHASVEFGYYPSGAVQKAYWSSAPDAGIQWYRGTTLFDEQGHITSETDDSYEGPGRSPLIAPGHTTVTLQPTVARCAVIYSSEFYFRNETPYTFTVHAFRKFRHDEHFEITIRPHKTAKLGSFILAEQFDEPEKYYDFTITAQRAPRSTHFTYLQAPTHTEQVSGATRRYFYEVRRII